MKSDKLSDDYYDAVNMVVPVRVSTGTDPPATPKASAASQTPRRNSPSKSTRATSPMPRRRSPQKRVSRAPKRASSTGNLRSDGYLPTRASDLRAATGIERKNSFASKSDLRKKSPRRKTSLPPINNDRKPKAKIKPPVPRRSRSVSPMPAVKPKPKREKIKVKKAGNERTKKKPVKANAKKSEIPPPDGWKPWSAVPRQFNKRDKFIINDD